MRAFLALPLPGALAERLADLALDLREGRPVPEENLHLTLVFLGDRDAAALEEFCEDLAARAPAAPTVELRGLGAFGGRRPRSAHARALPDPALSALRAAARRAARAAGAELPRERFSPHVTVARFGPRAPAGPGLGAWLEKHKGFRAAPFAPRAAVLMRSHLTPEGARYEELARLPLA